jgi:hypothetical protein
MSSDTIIPAYPYEGAFYWFLSGGRAYSQEHPYYRVLYGPSPNALSMRAAAIASLYPNILLGAADAHLPDLRSYLSGRRYHHPHLGITLDYDDNEWATDTQEIARRAAADPATKQLLGENALFADNAKLQHHFLCRTALQIRLAARSSGTLVGDDFFKRAYSVVAPWVPELVRDANLVANEPSKLSLREETVSLIGLDFAPSDLDAFAAIRSSKEIAKYTSSFREALAHAQNTGDLEGTLIEIMAHAMDTEEVAQRASSAFETAGSVMNVLGFIPVIGTLASAIGVGTDAAGRIAGARSESADWFLLGPKMREVALREALRRRRAD